MPGRFTTFLLLVALCLAVPACTRERSRAVSEEELDPEETPRDYREMLARARTKQSPALILSDLEQAVSRFRYELARLPTNLLEVVNRGYLSGVPTAPAGMAFTYDPVHGNVGLAELPDGSGIQLPSDITNLTPVRLQDVSLPVNPN